MTSANIIVEYDNGFQMRQPTIASMIAALQRLQERGVSEDEILRFGELANARGCYIIETLNRFEVQA